MSGVRERRRPFPDERDVLQHEGHADGRDQGRQAGRPTQRAIGEPVDGHVDRRRREHRREEHERQDGDELPAVQRPGHAEEGKVAQRDDEAQHEHVAVGEVDKLDDAVHHRVAHRDEREDGPARQSVDALLDEDFPPTHACGRSGGSGGRAGRAPALPPIAYSRMDSNANVQPGSLSLFTTLNPDMVSSVVSPFSSKLNLPFSPSKFLSPAMATRTASRFACGFAPFSMPAAARLIPSRATRAASAE